MMSFFLGIDSSTTATKALLMAADGRVRHVASSEYSYETPRPLWSEQQPDLWWQAAVNSIRQLLAETSIAATEIQGIGLTGQMHGLVLLDVQGQVLRPAILWNDQRTGAECAEIRARLGQQRLIQLTGNDALTGFTAPKLLWVKNNEPEIYAQIKQLLLPKDYVRFKLTGLYATDKAGGSGTLLFDVRRRDWSVEILQALEIDPAWLPPTFEGTAVTGTVTSEAAKQTGLAVGTPIFAGGGDQAAAAVGTGAVSEGIVSLSLGTSGVVFASADKPVIEAAGRLHTFCHAVPDKWHLMGVMLSAAGSLRWFRDTFAPTVDYDSLLTPAANIPAGCEGLLFLPYLTGERTPHADPLARGAFVGLTVRHTQAHMLRAVLEGVAFGLRDSFELMQLAGLTDAQQVRISGGGARSDSWRHILANVLGVELAVVNTTEGAAYGAAMLAAVGRGEFDSVETAAAHCVQLGEKIAPTGLTRYDEAYSVYQHLYPALKPIFSPLNRLAEATLDPEE